VNLADVMDDLGAALDTIAGLKVFPYWADRISPPAAVIGWPDPLTYDATAGRGADRLTLPVMVLVGNVDSRTARDRVAGYADGSAAGSVKAAVEAHAATAYDSARVMTCEFGVITVAGTEYLAGTFNIDIIGSGA
jgi:hypothetical protein